jgi:hypothetical protein
VRLLNPFVLAAALVLVGAVLAACSRDTRSADMKICKEEAENKTPTSELLYLRSAASEEERHDTIGSDIAACMARKGYRHDEAAMADGRCVDDVDYNPYCYRRGG